MDRKTLGLVAAIVVLMFGAQYVGNRIWPPVPAPVPSTNQVAETTSPAGVGTSVTVSSNGVVSVIPAYNGPEKLTALENEFLRLTFSTRGGGLKTAELKQYPAHVPRRDQLKSEASSPKELASLNLNAPLAALAIAPGSLAGDGQFAVTKQGDKIVSEKQNPDGLVIRYEYRLSTNSYQVEATMRLENRSTGPLKVPSHEWVVGTASPLDPHDGLEAQGLYWYNGSSAEHVAANWFGDHNSAGCVFFKKTIHPEYTADSTNLVWAAVYNQFFALLAQPSVLPTGIKSLDVALPKPTQAELDRDGHINPNPRGYQTTLIYPAVEIPAGQTVERHFQVYAGPKMYRILKGSDKRWDLLMDFTGFAGPCAKALLLILNGIHSFIPSYGWTIVVTTILIKLLFWPLTLASTRTAKRMQLLQPQINALKEKYKDNPQKQQEKTMQFMKENRINPAAGCLPMLVQLPVFFGYLFMLRTAIELRGESFLWCNDLSQPDTLFVIPQLGFIPLIGIPGIGLPFNLMPLFYIGSALWLSHSTPISPQMDASQQKMMRYLPLAFCIMFYKYSAGLTLYWTVQNLMNILQTKLTSTQKNTPGTTGTAVVVKPARA
ncbi:MAG TPA: membrane protein insertase YidC [Candidatus Limnocylindria bacterium]|nr:membrane protein insertase YidC [Candidatus Limnocylindria bacterium]